MQTQTSLSPRRLRASWRHQFNPIRSLDFPTLTRYLDEFQQGYLRSAAQAWDAIERRDDVIQGVASKRKKAAARHAWEIVTDDLSPEAEAQREALTWFFRELAATDALDLNRRGGFALLVEQMMDCIGKRYAVHEIVWQPSSRAEGARLTAEFRFVPLWFFENRTGHLRFLENETATEGVPLEDPNWMISVGDGLMESCSLAYLFKHLPLRDWLVYCERNGMPGVKGVTDAAPGSNEWEAAAEAVAAFGAEFHALMTRGTDIEAIDLNARGELPYPALVDRMDRAIIALWRGADLSTLSADSGVGVSLQKIEIGMLERADALLIADTLNVQVSRPVIRHLFGDVVPKARLRLRDDNLVPLAQDLGVLERLQRLGVEIPADWLRARFSIPARD